jgi:hypothetical protein
MRGEDFLDGDGLEGLAGPFLAEKIIEGRKAFGRTRFLRRHGRLLCEFAQITFVPGQARGWSDAPILGPGHEQLLEQALPLRHT